VKPGVGDVVAIWVGVGVGVDAAATCAGVDATGSAATTVAPARDTIGVPADDAGSAAICAVNVSGSVPDGVGVDTVVDGRAVASATGGRTGSGWTNTGAGDDDGDAEATTELDCVGVVTGAVARGSGCTLASCVAVRTGVDAAGVDGAGDATPAVEATRVPAALPVAGTPAAAVGATVAGTGTGTGTAAAISTRPGEARRSRRSRDFSRRPAFADAAACGTTCG